jgi:5'-nucleotidase
MRVLVSNDDGVDAPGIRVLAERLGAVGEVTVVAPDRDRSGASNSLTLDAPLRVLPMGNGYYRVAGTPTDCVHLALAGLLDEEPDIVVSGINNSASSDCRPLRCRWSRRITKACITTLPPRRCCC